MRRREVADGRAIPDSPIWILRHHAPNAIHHLRMIQSSTQKKGASGFGEVSVAAGDSNGQFSLTSLSDYRQRYFWKAHKESILGVDMQRMGSENVMVSSGRDNTLQLFALSNLDYLTSAVLPSRIKSELPVPECLLTLDINSLNYCPFSALSSQSAPEERGLLAAVPFTLDSGYIDIYHLPSKRRVVTAIGKADLATKSVKASRAAIVMSLQMIEAEGQDVYRILAGYEDGYVKMWKVEEGTASLEWSERQHTESIMAVAVSKDEDFAVSVAADHRVVRYDMSGKAEPKSIASNSAGHACIAIREDGELIAIGGWDGCVRLYNADLEQLGSLRYHKDTVQALSFVQSRDLAVNKQSGEDDDTDSGSESDGTSDDQTKHLLVSGGKEGRICLWKT
ncbi:hypothetical protein CBS101457_005260 [Exobasidium rhododendri]|nr:hypothetical protein CBS101457_005260 [Exobasidium rhododendri]